MAKNTALDSYLLVLAATVIELDWQVASVEEIEGSLKLPELTPLKLILMTVAQSVRNSQQLELLEKRRNTLLTHLESLQLALLDIQQTVAANPDPEAPKPSTTEIANIEQKIANAQRRLGELEQRINHLNETNQSLQEKFRHHLHKELKVINEQTEKKITAIMELVKSLPLPTSLDLAALKKEITVTLRSPKLQAGFLQLATDDASTKSFTQKLKELFHG